MKTRDWYYKVLVVVMTLVHICSGEENIYSKHGREELSTKLKIAELTHATTFLIS